MSTDDELRRLRALDTSAVSDALDLLGLDGVVTGIAALGPRRRVAGRAVTVELVAGHASAGAGHLATDAIDQAGPADIIVVAHAGRADVAGWGGNLHLAARARCVGGVIVDGAVRDADEIAGSAPPAFCRGVTPRSSRGRVFQRSFNQPIQVGTVPVALGDLVIADGSGVVVLAGATALAVIDQAEEIAALDERRADEIRAGTPVGQVMGAAYERQLQSQEARR